ncbi:extensin family protein [Halomonas sp. Bachu 37]|uniref:extensin-like domain-containing protein n=1 Tax=Halomonas kashgarensis TaxID=3084920 RepID=UPI00321694BF
MRSVIVFLLIIAIGITYQKGWWEIPRQWVPWQPLHVDDPLTLVTQWKLKRLSDDRQACLAALATTPENALSYTPLADHSPVEACPLENVVRVHSTSVSFNQSFIASCPLALAWVMFERHHLQPTAERLFDTRVSRVEHAGSFACRNVYGRETGRRSEHATAEALDVTGCRLDQGQHITLLRDWNETGEKGEYLQQLRDDACTTFGNVLGPEYNAAHADHFHLGMRGYRLCR